MLAGLVFRRLGSLFALRVCISLGSALPFLASRLPACNSVLHGSGLSLLWGIGFWPVRFRDSLDTLVVSVRFFGFCGVHRLSVTLSLGHLAMVIQLLGPSCQSM